MSVDIISHNKLGQRNGYCELYYPNGELGWKGVYVSGYTCGCFEAYRSDGSLRWSRYFINGDWVSTDNEAGDCLIWNRVVV